MARKGSRSGPPAAPAGGLHGAPKRKRTPPTADEAAADTAPHASKSVRTTARGVSRAKASRARSPPPGEGDDFEDDLGEHFAEPGDAAVASMTVAARRAAGKKPKKLRVATRHQKQPEAQQATRSCSSRDAWTAAPVSGTPQTASSQPHRPTFRQAPAHELDPGTQPLVRTVAVFLEQHTTMTTNDPCFVTLGVGDGRSAVSGAVSASQRIRAAHPGVRPCQKLLLRQK